MSIMFPLLVSESYVGGYCAVASGQDCRGHPCPSCFFIRSSDRNRMCGDKFSDRKELAIVELSDSNPIDLIMGPRLN